MDVKHGNTEPLFVQLERSQDCIEKLVKAPETIAREYNQRKQTHRYFTGETPIDQDEILDCWICEKPFGEEAKSSGSLPLQRKVSRACSQET